MKKLLLIVVTAISITSFGQTWTDHPVDSLLTVLLPDNYKITDTMGQQVITARIENGLILISSLANAEQYSVNIKSEGELKSYYKKFEQGYTETQHGQDVKDEMIEVSGLKAIRFTFTKIMNGEKQMRYCVAVFVKDKTYAINFWEPASMSNEMTATREKLFSSMKFAPGLGPKDQMTDKRKVDVPKNIGYLFGKLVLFGLIIWLIVRLAKRGKKQSMAPPPIKKPNTNEQTRR